MTIRNYTFFSPNGTEFPVSANADAKLYMMMAGNDYSQFMIRHWSAPTLTGLNKVYTNTSILLGGRYFELNNEPVVLNANTVNYIHANIDPSNVANPVTISVETSINSNSNDINSGNGVIKRLVDIVTTDATKVLKSETPEQSRNLEQVNASGVNVKSLDVTGGTNEAQAVTGFKLPYCQNGSRVRRVGNFCWIENNFAASQVVSGTPLPNGKYAVEKVPDGYKPAYRIDIFIETRSATDGQRRGRMTLIPDGRITDFATQNGGFKNTVDAMFVSTGMWYTTDPFPVQDIKKE